VTEVRDPSARERAVRGGDVDPLRADLDLWAESFAETVALRAELTAMRASLSWRITAPLRMVRARQLARRS